MSWIDKVSSDFIIVTGDGKSYRPLWLNAVKTFDFNVTEFEFINQQGGLIDRQEPRARRFNLSIFFEGENNLEESEAFEQSSFDKRAWTITHPYYGQIIVQPLGISFDNTKHNVSQITTTVVETITEEFPQSVESNVDKIISDVAETNELLSTPLANEQLSSSDIQDIRTQNTSLYNRGKNVATGLDSETYFNAFNTANNALFVIQDNPIQSIIDLQYLALAPARFVQSTAIRFKLLSRQFNELRGLIPQTSDKSKKIIYQSNLGTNLTAQTLSLATPIEGEYKTAIQVLDLAEELQVNYNNYITDLDSLMSDNGGELDSYIPNQEPLYALNDLVNFTIVNLINIALDSRRERSLILGYDTNIIELTHRLYGLDPSDDNINELMEQNNLSFDEILQIKHGRKIIYFV